MLAGLDRIRVFVIATPGLPILLSFNLFRRRLDDQRSA
jgi:hypothetical protein